MKMIQKILKYVKKEDLDKLWWDSKFLYMSLKDKNKVLEDRLESVSYKLDRAVDEINKLRSRVNKAEYEESCFRDDDEVIK